MKLCWLVPCFPGLRVKRCRRCLTTRCTVQWGNHTPGTRTKTISKRTTSHFQIPPSQPPNQQTETRIALQCPPHATAPTPAPRPNLSPQPPSPRILRRTRNQWCHRARKGGWHTTGLLYLPSPGRAFQSPRPPNPEITERALNSPSNTDRQQDRASNSPTKTVRKTLFLLSQDSFVLNCPTNITHLIMKLFVFL